MPIKNGAVKTSTSLRKDASKIFSAALVAADPVDSVVRTLRREKFERFRRIHVVGAGKAGASMALGAERVLGRRIATGLINVKDGHLAKLKRIELNECGHPIPDERGVAGARRIAEIAAQAGADDLVLCLISGGGSALMPLPAPPITLEEKQATTRLLLACGADIHEINALRKHISLIKGGQLARLAYPAPVLALLLSDVIGDDLDVIGSGPTAPDASTFQRVKSILDKYELWARVPNVVRTRIEAGLAGDISETPKPGDAELACTRNLVIGSNDLAVRAAAAKAKELGYRTLMLSTFVEGETREIARMHAAIAREIVRSGRPIRPPACIITGGETTVTIKGRGLGGRNQEFVLAAAIDIAGLPNVVILSGGTDGSDGPTDAAGAIADGGTLRRLPSAREYLSANDSYHYFQKLGDLLITGPTNTNVMDVRLILVGPASARG
jgi:hydroxypyruvate reductase